MSYRVQKLNAGHLEFACQFIAQLHKENGEEGSENPTPSYLSELLESNAFHVYVAIDDGKVVGGVSAYELPMFAKPEKEMFLYDIVVMEAYRQQGIARKLIDTLKDLCREKAIRIMFVGTSADSRPAIKLYEATGGEMDMIPWFTYNLELNRY